jgi:hypothetical protein
MVAFRSAPSWFAAPEYRTVPLPDPRTPELIVIHVESATAVQGQPANVVTVKLPVPPSLSTLSLAGLSEYVHGTPACETVTG